MQFSHCSRFDGHGFPPRPPTSAAPSPLLETWRYRRAAPDGEQRSLAALASPCGLPRPPHTFLRATHDASNAAFQTVVSRVWSQGNWPRRTLVMSYPLLHSTPHCKRRCFHGCIANKLCYRVAYNIGQILFFACS